ncbi:hypothetical protein DEJ28_01775 [Curtobacterium sp. MCPF17_002]|uniref:hypothetical protein n=1 Tax=Curtobacterium sp. MCPF17_002 TaxID=2175645 RepID=UPI000DA94CB9|nr:hypothetical protein [Curtobacterium sp. MCPF17_002]WIB77850.1 hypothetical protein DEJ28_01775 [Curtobacterium sp. MCPF17_002]
MSDRSFKRWLDCLEFTTPTLLASPHYGPIVRARGVEEELRQARIEWRERQERARARKLRYEASFAD